jgi:type I restriction enzyme S subunit
MVVLREVAGVRYGKAKPDGAGSVPVVGSGGTYGTTSTPLTGPNSLVIGRKGSAGSVWWPGVDCWPSDTTFYVEPDAQRVDTAFLYFWLIAHPLSGEHAKTTMPSLQKPDIEGLRIPLPPVDEQRRIAGILVTIRRASEAGENVLAATASLRKSLENQAFRNLKAPRMLLGDLLVQRQYGLSVRGNPKGRWPLLRMTNVTNGSVHFRGLQFVDISDEAARPYIVADGDILFNRTNSPALVGRTGLVRNPPPAVFASYLIRLRPNEGQVLPEYLNRYLNWDPIQQQIREMAARGVSQANVSASRLAQLDIPVPPIEEQVAIALAIETVQAKASAEQLCIDSIESCFRTVLNRLLRPAA